MSGNNINCKIKNKSYIYMNITLVCVSIYVIFFPLFANVLSWISPALVRCPYLRVTGNPCPLCGGTRFLANWREIFHDPTYLFQPFGYMILYVLGSLIFRIIVLRYASKKGEIPRWVILLDIVVNAIAAMLYIVYVVTFFSH